MHLLFTETKEERPRRSKLSSREQQLKRERTRAKRTRTRRQSEYFPLPQLLSPTFRNRSAFFFFLLFFSLLFLVFLDFLLPPPPPPPHTHTRPLFFCLLLSLVHFLLLGNFRLFLYWTKTKVSSFFLDLRKIMLVLNLRFVCSFLFFFLFSFSVLCQLLCCCCYC